MVSVASEGVRRVGVGILRGWLWVKETVVVLYGRGVVAGRVRRACGPGRRRELVLVRPVVLVVELVLVTADDGGDVCTRTSVASSREKMTQILTDLNEETNDCDGGVENLLPCAQIERADVGVVVLVGHTALVELLAGVDEVEVEAHTDSVEQDDHPYKRRVCLHHTPVPDHRADESAGTRSAFRMQGAHRMDAPEKRDYSDYCGEHSCYDDNDLPLVVNVSKVDIVDCLSRFNFCSHRSAIRTASALSASQGARTSNRPPDYGRYESRTQEAE